MRHKRVSLNIFPRHSALALTMKRSYQVALYLSSFLALNFLCKSLTDDFSTHFLVPAADKGSIWNISQQPAGLKELLSQKYTYLSKGKQAYVFISEDQKHVLKLFKPPAPFLEVPLFGKKFHIGLAKIPFVKSLCIDYSSPSYQTVRDLEFQSYINSYHLLPEKTLLEYLHLAQTDHLNTQLKIFDKIGVLHTINLDSTCFLIQKKTDLLYPTLSTLLKHKEIEQAKLLLSNFVDFYFDLIDQDIVNPTTLEKNIGCIDFRPVQIDVGRVLRPQDLGHEEKVPLTQIYKSTSHMKKWLKTRSPSLYLYIKQIEEEKLKSRSKQEL